MGHGLVKSYFETLIGKPLLAIIRLLGPQRNLMRMRKNFHGTCSYSKIDFYEHGPGDYELRVNEAGHSRFVTLEILQRGVQMEGAPEAKIDIVTTGDDSTRYRVRT